jgi:uncharacterized protein with ParB-like and HNH nuclease domain
LDRFEFIPTTLKDLISTRFFSVPRYQRSYAWASDEVSDFWNDMRDSITDGGDYFLGNIVLTSLDGADKSHQIIDGQQRIATTTILNAAIRDVYSDEGDVDAAAAIQQEMICAHDTATHNKIARIKLNDVDDTFYKSLLIDKSEPKPTSDSHRLISSAYDFFKSKICEVKSQNPSTWRAELGKISHFLGQQARVISVYAANDADAFIIFETLNDRGADLTIADLLKNYLFSKSGNEIDSVQKNWIDARAILEEYQPENEFIIFLRHYWSSVYGMTRERELYKSIKNNISDKVKAVKFSSEIKQGAKHYGAALSEKSIFWNDYSDTDRNNVKLLLRLKLEQNRPLLLAILQHFSKQEIQKTLPLLISWSVRGLIAGVMGKGAAETTFCESATKIRSGEIKSHSDLRISLSTLVPSDASFVESFAAYRTRNNGFARFLLLGLEGHLSGTSQPELVPNERVDEVNLEHVLPQRPKSSDWLGLANDEALFHSLKLGNMTLLQEKKNNAIGNKPFVSKKPIIAASNFELNKYFVAHTDWTVADIDSRQKVLANIAPKVWKL